MAAIEDLKRAGATIVDPVAGRVSPVCAGAQGSGSCGGFKYDINRYLAGQGDRVPVKTLEEIIRSRRFHPSIEARLQSAQEGTRERTRDAGLQGGSGISRRVPRRGREDDGRRTSWTPSSTRRGAIRRA